MSISSLFYQLRSRKKLPDPEELRGGNYCSGFGIVGTHGPGELKQQVKAESKKSEYQVQC